MLGNRIKRLRIARGLNQDEFVEGIASIAYLSKVENGQTVPSKQFISQICKKMGIDTEFLLSSEITPLIEEEITNIFLNYWKNDVLEDNDLLLIQMYFTELHSNKILLMVFSILLRYYYCNAKLSLAKDVFTVSEEMVSIEDISESEAELIYYYLLACGVLHFDLYDFIAANEILLKAELYLPNENREVARLYYNLFLINQRINRDKSVCLHYSKKAYEAIKKTKDTNRLIEILLTRSILFYQINSPEQALSCILEAENLNLSTENNKLLQASITYNYGRIHQLKGFYPEAISYYEEFIHITEVLIPERTIRAYKGLQKSI